MNKLTPEAEALRIAESVRPELSAQEQAFFIAGYMECIKAQELYTREQVREFIKAAVSIGGRNPGIEADAGKVADTLLPPIQSPKNHEG